VVASIQPVHLQQQHLMQMASLLKTQLRVRLQLVIIRTAQQLTLHMLVVLVQ
jgi:hypothetical protein